LAAGGEKMLDSLARLDDYRNAGRAAPEQLSNAVLAGSLLVPLGVPLRPPARPVPEFRDQVAASPSLDLAAEMAALGEHAEPDAAEPAPDEAVVLPVARRDLDRLRLALAAQPRLREIHRSPRVKHLLAGRGYFEDALRWMEIHGGLEDQELAAHWRSLDCSDVTPAARPEPGSEPAGPSHGRRKPHAAEPEQPESDAAADGDDTPSGGRRRRRRRRRGGRRRNAKKGEPTDTNGGDPA
jgi:hypothetical protein